MTIAGQDDAVEASVRFDASADAFGRASAGLQTWWARPALVVPVVGREVRAATVLSSAGQRLARAAAAASTEVDLAGLRVRDGRIDLIAVNQADRVISGVLDEVRRAQADVGSVSSPWLIRPLAKAVHELNGRLLQADRESTVAKHVLDLVGPMAGSEGSRRWLLAVVTPAEERGSGGLVGNVGEVTAVAGKLDLVNIRRIARLNDAVDPAAAAQVIPKIYSGQYSGWNVSGKLQNALVAPDFPTGAHALLAVQPLAGQGQVDGVISVDPLALAAILQLVGPVRVAGWPDPIDSANAATVLLHDQYVALQGNAREDFLGDVTDAVWARITSGTLPSPATLARTLKPLVDGRHIQLYSGRQAEEAGIVRVGAGGVLPESGVDHVALVANNASESKADWYLHRSLDYRVQYDPGSGLTDATVTVKLTNDAPATGLPPYVLGGSIAPPGYNRQIVEVHTPLDLVSATVDGRPPAGLRSLGSPGHHVDEVDLVVAPRSTATIELHLRGQQEPSLRWSLDVGRQPSIYADDVSVSLRVTGGWRIVDAGGGLAVGASDAAAHLRLNGPRRLTAILGPKP